MGAHTTSDDPTRYRVAAEVEVWKQRDPIERLKALLSHEGKADAGVLRRRRRRGRRARRPVRERCLAMPDPAGTAMFDDVYAEPHPVVERERAQFVAYQAGFADGGN